jgi:hypothetical protein
LRQLEEENQRFGCSQRQALQVVRMPVYTCLCRPRRQDESVLKARITRMIQELGAQRNRAAERLQIT